MSVVVEAHTLRNETYVSISLKNYFQYCLEVKIRQLKYVLIICKNMVATCGYNVTSCDKFYHVRRTLKLNICGEWRTDPQASTSMEVKTTAPLFS